MDIFDSVDNAKPSGDVFDAVATGPASKPKGLLSTIGDSFKGAGARMAQGVNESLGSINHAFGMDEGAKMYQENADYWKQKAEEAGSNGLAAKIYTGIGEAPAGVAEFMGNVPYAAAKGVVEGYREDGLTGAMRKGALEGVKRLGVGKVFHGIENTGISGMTKAAAMGGTMGAQTAAEQYGATGTVNPEDVAASTATGAVLSLDGGGKAAEVKRNLLNEGVQSDIAQDLSSRVPMTLATARERLQKSKVEIPDTGITDDSVSVDQAIASANAAVDWTHDERNRLLKELGGDVEEPDKPSLDSGTGGEAISTSFLDPAMIKAVEQRKGAPLQGELTPEELRAQDVSAAMNGPVLNRDALEEVEANKTDPLLAAAMADGRTRQFDLGESGPLETLTPYRPDFVMKKEGVIEPEVIPPEAAKPVSDAERLALPAPEDVKQLPYRGEAAKVPETKEITDAQIPPVAGLSEPVDTQVLPEKGEEVAKAPDLPAVETAPPDVVKVAPLPKAEAPSPVKVDNIEQEALAAMREGRVYLSRDGNTFMLSDEGGGGYKPSGKLTKAPWDKSIRAKYPDFKSLYDAAKEPAPVGEKVAPAAKEIAPPSDTTSATRNVLQQLTSPKRKSDTLVSNLKDAHGKDILNQLAKQEMIRFPGQGRAEVTKAGARWLEENPAPRTAKQQERYNILSRKKNLTEKDRVTLAELERLPEAGKEPAKVQSAPEPVVAVEPAPAKEAEPVDTPADVVKEAVKVAKGEGITLKEQKKYLLENLDDAIKSAPDTESDDIGRLKYELNTSLRSALTDASNRKADADSKLRLWNDPERFKDRTAEERSKMVDTLQKAYDAAVADQERISPQIKDAQQSLRDAGAYVTIHVPDDGTFEVYNTKAAIKEFKEKVAKLFPAAEPKSGLKGYGNLPKPTSIKMEGLEGGISGKDASGNDWHTNGHVLIKGKPLTPIKSEMDAKTKDRAVNGLPDAIKHYSDAKSGGDVAAVKYVAMGPPVGKDKNNGKFVAKSDTPIRTTKDETGYAVLSPAEGKDVYVSQKLFLYAKEHHPNATIRIGGETDPVKFVDRGKVVAVVMPVRGGDKFASTWEQVNTGARYSIGDSEATITPEVLSKVTDVLVKALPDKVDLRVVPSIDYSGPGMDEAFAQHGVKTGKVEGLHQAVLTNGELRSIITLSMDGATERTGYHEILHAAESLRLIKSKDLAILERAYPTKDGVDSSERRADAFADYVAKKEQPANSLIRAMFDRIISFTHRLKAALNGEGWRTADDVFKDLLGGKLMGNAENAKPSGPQFSVQKDDKPDLIPISDQFRIVRETADKLNKFADRSKFIKSDVKPAINTAIEGTNVAVDGIRRAVNPMARSDAAEAAGRILIEGMGKMAHDVDKFKGELNKALDQYNEQTGLMAKAKDLLTNSTGIIADKVFAALPEKERYDFMQRMDAGEEQATPELQAVADTVKKMFDEKVEAVQKLGTGALDNARDSYFPHIWERGEDAARQIMAGLSRRPLEGAKSFAKQRVFDDVQAGIDAGYKMVSSNPLDIVFLKMAEMDKYINAHSALQAMEDSGLVQLIPAGEKPHADFSDISGRYGVVTKREAVDPSTGEVNMKSYRYVARDDVAQIFNNYLSQSLYNNKYVGGIYKAYMGAANNLNMFQLGVFSAFHAGFTSHEAVISHASVGMKALSRGDFKTAAKYLAEAPAAWVTNPILGDKIIKAWMGGDAPKEMPQIVQWLELAGARRAMDTRFRTNATQKMMEKWGEGNKLGAAVKTIPAIVGQSARPIMEWLVPRQKFGVFGEMANDWVQRNPNATHEELRENMQKIWNRVDSRLGQVVYDRMFLHNVSKNVAQALIRAPGWTGGTILEVGGGTKDLAKYAKDIAMGKKAEMSDRAAYTVSMLAVTGMMNAMLTAAFTGDKPKDWKDLVAFRTGNLDEQGNPERFMLPTYMKDVYAYASDIQSGEPLRTIGHKTHPLLSLMGDIKKNRDYYGVEIRHEGDNPVHQGAQLAGYVAKAFVPFWLRGLQKEQERGGSALAKTAPFIGVMPAPSDMNKSEAEKLAQKLMVERMPNNAKTKEDFERNQTMKKLTNSLRKGEPDASDKIRQVVQDGTITLKQAHNIRNNAKLDPLEVAFKRLGYEEAQKVMEVATDEEKEQLQRIFKKKERNYKMTHPKSRTQNED